MLNPSGSDTLFHRPCISKAVVQILLCTPEAMRRGLHLAHFSRFLRCARDT
jgi:hypothetical protein